MTVAAVILAAGLSRRMTPRNKLLIPDESGRPMIAHVVGSVLASAARPVLVVVGHQAEEIARVLTGMPVQLVRAQDYAAGLSASLKAGIRAVPERCSGAIVCLGDMPLVTGSIIERLLAAYAPKDHRSIVVPSFHGKRGNPVLWDRRYFPEILELSGDAGARRLFAFHKDEIVEVEMADEAVLRDIDSPEALAEMPRWT